MAKKEKKDSENKKSKKEVKPLTESEKLRKFEKDLWDVACKLWTNTNLRPVDYKIPVLALIFLRFADQKFEAISKTLESKSSRRDPGPDDYKAKGIVYLPPKARWDYLKSLAEGDDVGAAINNAMGLIEENNEDLKGILPKTFNRFRSEVLLSLMRVFHGAQELEGDNFGRIYEFFMSEFEKDSGQKGGEFFTPPSIVKLIVEIIEPYHGKIYDPACGSGGMFAQSAKFVEAHKKRPSEELAAFGQEKTAETIKIAKMNLAISGFSGTIKGGNSYYDDEHKATGKFDFVMANPPFNASGVDKDRIKDDKKRYPFGMPSTDNANYLWVQLFYSALNESGRAGFVMPDSATDSSGNDAEIRKALVERNVVDAIIQISTSFFYTVTQSCTLWFLDKRRSQSSLDTILMIDARNIFTVINRALREFSNDQVEFVSNICKLHRGESPSFEHSDKSRFESIFPGFIYRDVPGLCIAVNKMAVEQKNWSLNPTYFIAPAEDFSSANMVGDPESIRSQLRQLDSKYSEVSRHLENDLDVLLPRMRS